MNAERTFSAAAKLGDLSDQQKREVEEQSRPNAALIHETIRAEGESELERGARALVCSALAAGLSIGFSMVGEGELYAQLPAGPARDLLAPLGYTIGFLIVVVGRQQLFTENTLTPVLVLMHTRNWYTLKRVLRLWGIVLAANVAGAILFATALARGDAFAPDLCRVADCTHGVAAARRGGFAPAHHPDHHLRRRTIGAVAYHRRLGRLRLSRADRRGILAGFCRALLRADTPRQHRGGCGARCRPELRAGRTRGLKPGAAQAFVAVGIFLHCFARFFLAALWHKDGNAPRGPISLTASSVPAA